MPKYTKQQKKEYFANMRKHWKETKDSLAAGELKEIEAIIITHGMNISAMGFKMVMMQMEAQGFEGLPYLDAKTFKGWKENGFKVRKGEHSTIDGITWISTAKAGKKLEDCDTGFMFPKCYHLFHRTQVQAIEV